MTTAATSDSLGSMNETVRIPIASLIVISLAAMAVASFGIWLAMDEHYAPLTPALTSSGALFVYAWPVPFMLMALGAAIVRVSTGSLRASSPALGLYFLMLALALSWCVLAFRFAEPRAAFALLGTLFVLTLITIQAFARHSRPAAWMQLPWLIWVTIALYLSLRALIINYNQLLKLQVENLPG